MDTKEILDCQYVRRFGVELEVNAFDQQVNKTPPGGIHEVAWLVSKALQTYVEVRPWGLTHWNHTDGIWVVKPDHSCGMEVCSPVVKGDIGLRDVSLVADALAADTRVTADDRCSLHVHINVADLSRDEVAQVLAYWVKCEPLFMDCVPRCRKTNRFCRFVGVTDAAESSDLIHALGQDKYWSANSYHYFEGKRQTLEFRLGHGGLCLSGHDLKMWVRLLLQFVERARVLPSPGPYRPRDPWSWYCWLDPVDFFTLMGWDNGTPTMGLLRKWFIDSCLRNLGDSGLPIQQREARTVAQRELTSLSLRKIHRTVSHVV